jgi:hypothetical protein
VGLASLISPIIHQGFPSAPRSYLFLP